MITNILSNLPEEYQTIMGILEYKLDDKENPWNIKNTHGNMLVKYEQERQKKIVKSFT